MATSDLMARSSYIETFDLDAFLRRSDIHAEEFDAALQIRDALIVGTAVSAVPMRQTAYVELTILGPTWERLFVVKLHDVSALIFERVDVAHPRELEAMKTVQTLEGCHFKISVLGGDGLVRATFARAEVCIYELPADATVLLR
jgi:hypothetical protein